jgi:hypothetical protein
MAIECDTELYCSGDIIAADISCGELSCNNGYIEEDISAKIVSFNELLRIGGNAKFDSVNHNGILLDSLKLRKRRNSKVIKDIVSTSEESSEQSVTVVKQRPAG